MAANERLTKYFSELTPMMFSVWHDKAGPFVQMTHFLYGIGGIVAPLVAKPFLINTRSKVANIGETLNKTSQTDWHYNCSQGPETILDIDNTSMLSMCNYNTGVEKYTQVHFPYLIGALLMFSAAFPFIIFCIKGQVIHSQNSSSTEGPKKVVGKFRILAMIILLTLVHGVGMAVTYEFQIYLATFGILELKWSQGTGSSMTSLYFATYAVGSVLGAFILKFITARIYIYISYIGTISSLMLFYVGIHWKITPLQTIPIALFGIAASAIMPTIFTWTQQAITPVSGTIASAFYFAGSIGSFLNPIIFAYLMESVHQCGLFMQLY